MRSIWTTYSHWYAYTDKMGSIKIKLNFIQVKPLNSK